MANRWRKCENSVRFHFLGFWNSYETKRRLLLGRKTMPNLDRVLKSRDITLPTKIHAVKAMVFPVVKHGSGVAQSRPTLSHPMACSMPSSSVHGISQARILEWVAISFSRGSSWPRDRIHVSCIGRWIPYHQTTREALRLWEIFRIIQNSKSTRSYASENLPLFPRHSGLLPDSDKCY